MTECFVGPLQLLDRAPVQTAIRIATLGRRCGTATPRRRITEVFSARELRTRIVEPSGLRLMQPLQLEVSPETLDNVTRLEADGSLVPATGQHHPHIALRTIATPWTSVCLPLAKP